MVKSRIARSDIVFGLLEVLAELELTLTLLSRADCVWFSCSSIIVAFLPSSFHT